MAGTPLETARPPIVPAPHRSPNADPTRHVTGEQGSTDRLPPVFAEYIAAFEALDLDRIIVTHAEDATFEEVPTGIVREGRAAIRLFYDATTSALSDLSVTFTSAFAAGPMAAGEWTLRGRYTGQVEGLPPGEGQELMVRGVDILELADSFIQHIHEYPDYLGLLIQVGAIPGQGEAAREA